MVSIEQEHTLKNALQLGANLFIGSGFSTLAKDKNNDCLPTGRQLASELHQKFGCPLMDLPMMSTIIESKYQQEFFKFLQQRFSVKNFPSIYNNINSINIKNIFTTNIDDLLPQIVNNSQNKFINDQKREGISRDKNAINYLALHGNVLDSNQKYIFTSTAIATIYHDDTRIWNYLTVAIETYPTIFLGYSLSDTGTLNAIFSRNTFRNAQKDKWILLLETDRDKEAYIKALGFNIIWGDIESFLNWIPKNDAIVRSNRNSDIKDVFPKNLVPRGAFSKEGIVRPIEEYFRGASPIWHDIQSGLIYKTEYFKTIQDSIFSNKNTIIIGAPATGKTTVAMQVAYGINYNGEKLMFDNLTTSKVDYIIKIIQGKNALIFIENFTDDIEAFMRLCCSRRNIKVVGIDRSHYFGIISHFVNIDDFDIINVSDPNPQDLQGIYNSLPTELRYGKLKKENRTKYSSDTIFEFVLRNIKKSTISERYEEVLNSLIQTNQLLAEFLILCAYCHSSRIPLSSEMAISYFSQDCGYAEVFNMRRQINDLIKDFDDSFRDRDENLDYYYPKSYFIAENLIKKCPKNILQTVLCKFITNLSPIQICDYNNFKRHGFDKNIVNTAFQDTSEGRRFYEEAFMFDYQNPFVLQQGALFLSGRKQFGDAFRWIDRAVNMTNNTYFSIRNSHAVILFDANIDKVDENARLELDRSMAILEKCIHDDKKTTFHALRYATQSIDYAKRYNDQQAIDYLKRALSWLKEEHNAKKWNNEINQYIDKVNDLLSNMS